MLRDLRIAIRSLRRSPAFALVAMLTLALGIGATTAVFSVVNGVLLRPLAGLDTNRLVRISETSPQGGLRFPNVATYREWLRQSTAFEGIAANQFCAFNLTGSGDPEQIMGPCTTANWFDVLKAQAMLGRTFLPDEDQPGKERVVVLEHGYWLRRFGGDRGLIGRTVTLNGHSYLVIGVMPSEFQPLGAGNAPIFVPYVLDHHPETGVVVTARLRPNVSLDSARSELAVIDDQLERSNPKEYGNRRSQLSPLLEDRVGAHRGLLLLLLGAVSLVLLIAAANIASLFVARALTRQRELSIRAALGAGRWRMIRYILAEALIVALGGCLAGAAVAWAGGRLLLWRLESMPRIEEVSMDWRMILFALSLAFFTALLFGGAPAIAMTRTGSSGESPVLRDASKRSRWTRRVLVTAQIGLAFMLLMGAGLLIRSFRLMRAVELGYDSQQVLTGFLALPESGSRTAGVALYRGIRQRLGSLPGVKSVATASQLPMGGVIASMHVVAEGNDPENPRPGEPQAHMAVVSGQYFGTLRIPLRQGRTFTDDDRPGSTPVAIVSESVANRYFPSGAIGRRILLPELTFNISGSGQRWITTEIAGVVGDVRRTSVRESDVMHLYLAESQNALRMSYLAVRTEGDPMLWAESVKRAVSEEATNLPVADLQPLDAKAAFLTDPPRHGMWLLSIFSVLAVALAAIGIYGVVSYAVAERRREIGIRMALGATERHILKLVTCEGLLMMVVGFGAGSAGSVAFTRSLEALLYGVGRADLASGGAAALVLALTAALSSFGPARASLRIDPARTLRDQY